MKKNICSVRPLDSLFLGLILAWLLPVLAVRAAAPSAVTLAPENLTSSSAALVGQFNGNGTLTWAGFDNASADAPLGENLLFIPLTGNEGAVEQRVTIVGLEPRRTYQFRARATNSFGAAYGSVVQFTTPSGPPTIVFDMVDNVVVNAAQLNGIIRPETLNTYWYAEWGLTTNYSQRSGTTFIDGTNLQMAASLNITGLVASTSYHCRLVASNSSGFTYGQDRPFTTSSGAPLVEGSFVEEIRGNSALIHAVARPEPADTWYFMQWGPTTNYAQRTGSKLSPASNPLEGLLLTISNLTALSNYHCRVVASNSAGVAYGEDLFFTTLAPLTFYQIDATNITFTGATLPGAARPNGADSTLFLEYGLTTAYGLRTTAYFLPDGHAYLVDFEVGGLTPDTTYHYRLVGSNVMGQAVSSDYSITTLNPLPALVMEQPSALTTTGATLRATATTRGAAATAWFEFGLTTGYGSRSADFPLASNDTVYPLSAPVFALDLNTTYHYRAVASNEFGVVYGADVALHALSDYCSNAVVAASLPFSHTQSTVNATSAGDAAMPCEVSGKGVWYKIIPAIDGLLTVDTAGSSHDTVMTVYSGACGALTPLACNDEVAPGVHWSSNSVVVQGGGIYYVQVGGYYDETGLAAFHARLTPAGFPAVAIIGVTNLAAHSVTVRASIDPKFTATTAWVNYQQIAPITGPVQRSLSQFSANTSPYQAGIPLLNLQAGATYSFAVQASNIVGLTSGFSQSFTTLTDNSKFEDTIPTDTVIGTSGNSPVGQTAAFAIDNNATTKYLNFDKLNSGLTLSPSGNRTVRALTLISAEDAPERDPSSFVIEGSLDGVNFTRITSNAVPAFPTRHFVQSFAFANTNDFISYRVLFPTVSNALTANSMQVAEVELLPYGEITSSNDTVSITLPGGAQDVRGVRALFDRQLDDTNKLEVAPIAGGNTTVDIIPAAGATVLRGFELIGAADDFTFPQRRPSFVGVAGSNDGTNYTLITTVSPIAPSSNLQLQEFATLANTNFFARYRVTFGPPVSGDRIQVGEMRLFGEVNVVLPALNVRASGGNLLVSWPHTAGFNLEKKLALSDADWTTVTNAPALSNGVNTVTLPMDGPMSFFRLRK